MEPLKLFTFILAVNEVGWDMKSFERHMPNSVDACAVEAEKMISEMPHRETTPDGVRLVVFPHAYCAGQSEFRKVFAHYNLAAGTLLSPFTERRKPQLKWKIP